VLITVAATVFGLIPLAMHGGPLWEPLCYVQIGGLSVATAITLVLVPVLYTVFVKDLKLVKWDERSRSCRRLRPMTAASPPSPLPPWREPAEPSRVDASSSRRAHGWRRVSPTAQWTSALGQRPQIGASGSGLTQVGRIISLSSCERIWQCHT
jgi:hypothetical protein